MTEGSKIQYFTLFRTLSLPYQFYHCPRNFFPSSYYHFSTSFFEAFKVTFISFPPTTLSADLLTALLLCCCSKKGLTKMPFKFFFSWSELLWSEDWPHFSRADFLDVQQLNVVEERLRRQRSEMRCNFLQLNYSGC